ncbi:MAG: transposase [Desulfobacterales bacterium]|jgi:regulator of replication initiation timing|nr:transposase [Desulfobacterales bacterium]
MTKKDIIEVLENIQNKIENIEDKKTKEILSVLYNLVEDVLSDNTRLREENQALKDEINKLKGEQGKPDIKPNNKNDGDISSEQERKDAETPEDEISREGFKLGKPSLEKLKENRIPAEVLEQLKRLTGKKYSSKAEFIEAVKSAIGSYLTNQYIKILVKYARYKKRKRIPKLPEIQIDREEKCAVDTKQLPKNAQFKGYEDKVVQDLIIKTDNVRFKREIYYSASMKKTWLGKVPVGYEGDFGPHINSHIISMKYVNNMSIPKINEFLNNFGILISGSYISDRLTKHIDVFHQEKAEIYLASLESSSYQQIDDTGSRVNGQNYYTQIVCNPLATVFFTTKRKDRLTILDVLRNFESRHFLFNEETFSLLEQLKIPQKLIILLHKVETNTAFNEQEMHKMLNSLFPDPNKGKLHRTKIMEAGAIAYYHQEIDMPIVKLLLCDDAPQFKLITDDLSLCWVHDGRHYKRLRPVVQNHQKELTAFRGRYWNFYRELYKYKKNPSCEIANFISAEFDILFSTKTGYNELDVRIAKSKAKKEELLTVLNHPEIPLHNNRSENGARVQKRREDVSLQTKTKAGTEAKDTMMTIIETAKKHSVSSYKYIYDRISKIFKMPSLAKLIRVKSASQPTIYNSG